MIEIAFELFMPTVAFNICCPRDWVSRHNGGTAGAPLKPLRDDSAFRTLSSLRGLRGAPEVPPLCRETQSLGQQMLNATVGINDFQGNVPDDSYRVAKLYKFLNNFSTQYDIFQNYYSAIVRVSNILVLIKYTIFDEIYINIKAPEW